MTEEIKTTTTVVPALPGFDVVYLCGDKFEFYPLVAWVVAAVAGRNGTHGGSRTGGNWPTGL
jgi:hypothetical protein